MNVLNRIDHIRNVPDPHDSVSRRRPALRRLAACRQALSRLRVAARAGCGRSASALVSADHRDWLTAAGRPVLAAAELTGPLSVAMISGAYAAAPNSWSVALTLQRRSIHQISLRLVHVHLTRSLIATPPVPTHTLRVASGSPLSAPPASRCRRMKTCPTP